MVIVLIHWRIKPTDEAEGQFRAYWRNTARIDDKSGLAGEFLSAPLPAHQFTYRVDDLSLGQGILDCRHFVNIGLWRDKEAFEAQVGRHMRDDKPLQPFEADRRTRTILTPQEWRIGIWPVPSNGTCE